MTKPDITTPLALSTLEHTLAIKLGYHGAPFHGFARQHNLLTVQGNVEEALSTLLKREVQVVGAGRTDSGVHARGQVVSTPLSAQEALHLKESLRAFKRSLNALTHTSISIKELEVLDFAFSARFDATMRRYRYSLSNMPYPPIFTGDFSWHIAKPLDLVLMKTAAKDFIGEHDYIAFAASATTKEQKALNLSTKRFVKEVNIFKEQLFDEELITIEVVGNAFLHSMVRTMVGTLVEIGLRKRDAASIPHILASLERAQAGQTAPAKGLRFYSVEYKKAFIQE